MQKETSKGITAVIGTILLVAIAVILIVIIATFFIGFTGTQSRDIESSTPTIQVLTGSNCMTTKGKFIVNNQLENDIKQGDLATVLRGTTHIGFYEVTKSNVRAGQAEDLYLKNVEGDQPPIVYDSESPYTIKFTTGAADGQDVTITCNNPSNYFRILRGDASKDTIEIETTQTLKGKANTTSCTNSTYAGNLTLWSGTMYLSGAATNASNYCFNNTLTVSTSGSKTTFTNVALMYCNGTACTQVDLTPNMKLTLKPEDTTNVLYGQASTVTIGA